MESLVASTMVWLPRSEVLALSTFHLSASSGAQEIVQAEAG